MTVRHLLELVSGTNVIIYDKYCNEVARIVVAAKIIDYNIPYVEAEIDMLTSNEEGIQICV